MFSWLQSPTKPLGATLAHTLDLKTLSHSIWSFWSQFNAIPCWDNQTSLVYSSSQGRPSLITEHQEDTSVPLPGGVLFFVILRFDYSNFLLTGSSAFAIWSLQLIQNVEVYLFFNLLKFFSWSPCTGYQWLVPFTTVVLAYGAAKSQAHPATLITKELGCCVRHK